MPQEKNSIPASTGTPESITSAEEADQKNKAANAKVTLVKPIQAGDEPLQNESPAEVAALASTPARPKVGRSGGGRKRKNETGNAKSGKVEKKTTKARKAKITAAIEEKKAASAASGAEDSIEGISGPDTDELAWSLQIKSLREGLKHTELPPEWEKDHARPWGFMSILFCVILFVAINWGLVTFFNQRYHKNEEPTAPVASHTEPVFATPESAPAGASIPSQISEQSNMTAPATDTIRTLPQALPKVPDAASAPALAEAPAVAVDAGQQNAEAAAREKANSQQELYSIITKE